MTPVDRQKVFNLLEKWAWTGDQNVWAVMIDVVEESGPADEVVQRWESVLASMRDFTAGPNAEDPPRPMGTWLDALRGLLDVAPAYAHELIAKLFPLVPVPDTAAMRATNSLLSVEQQVKQEKTCGKTYLRDLELEKVGLVVGEAGNLEQKPWPVVGLVQYNQWDVDYHARTTQYVTVEQENPVEGERPLRVTVNEEPTQLRRLWIGTVYLPDGREFELDRIRAQNSQGFDLDHSGRPMLALPEWADEAYLLDRGEAILAARRATRSWRGQRFSLPRTRVHQNDGPYVVGEMARRNWLWMDSAPEYLELDTNGEFRTAYTDGGGFQSSDPDYLLDPKTLELWQMVENEAHTGEADCPFLEDDSRSTERRTKVLVSQTQCGERPKEACRYCGNDVGEDHGYINIGEGNVTVYQLIPSVVEEEDE